ncbi:IQ and ubiquitin-like domain-containing protein, partial [Pseudolycoriella hygida]
MEKIPEIVTPPSDISIDVQESAPSISNNSLVIYEKVTVKFQLNDLHTVAQVYSNQSSIEAVKKDIGEKFQVKPEYLSIRQGSFRVPNSWRLFEVESNRFGIVEFQLSLNRLAKEFNENVDNPSERIHLDADVYYSHYHLPHFLSVCIPSDDCEEANSKRVIVEIISKPIVKPYVGGFISKKKEYHDAFTQTGPVFEAIKWDGVVSRECQAGQTDQSLMTKLDEGTQMFGEATETIFVEKRTNSFIAPRKFESVDELFETKINKVKIIQRNARRYLLKKFVKKFAAEWRERCQRQPEIDRIRSENILDRFRRECTVNTFPKTKEDFNLLYTQIQRWKEAEIKRINQLYVGGHRIAELHVILDKEIQLFNGIERLRTKLRKHNAEVQTGKMLDQMGTPTKWILSRERAILATNVDEESLDSLRQRQLALLIQFMQSKKFKLD